MTLPRLLLAMTLRSLATRLEQRLDPIASTIVGAVGYATEGRWDVDGVLAVPGVVGELGARVSGAVAGCGCDADGGCDCPCGCHEASTQVVFGGAGIARALDELAYTWTKLKAAREALAARPKPEVEPDYFWCPSCKCNVPWGEGPTAEHPEICVRCAAPLSYGVTAPGGC